VFPNDYGIVAGFDNLSVLNFDPYLKSDTKNRELSRTVKMTGIKKVRFINQTILTKSVCNDFKPITTP
jgi:hypothetical protein